MTDWVMVQNWVVLENKSSQNLKTRSGVSRWGPTVKEIVTNVIIEDADTGVPIRSHLREISLHSLDSRVESRAGYGFARALRIQSPGSRLVAITRIGCATPNGSRPGSMCVTIVRQLSPARMGVLTLEGLSFGSKVGNVPKWNFVTFTRNASHAC